MSCLGRLVDALELYTGGVLAVAATGSVVYATLSRYLVHEQPSWTIEVVVYLIVWASFVLASRLMKEGGHVGADFLVARLPTPYRRLLDAATSLAALGFMLVVAWLGVLHVYDAYDFGEVSPTSVRFPMWVAYAAVPAGAVLVAFRLVERLVRLAVAPETVPLIRGDDAA